jgi:hypothetical protein
VPDPDRRKDRWTGTTPEQRRAQMAEVTAAKTRAAIDRRIDELIASAPPLTEQQRAKLGQLLDSQPAGSAW